MSAPPAEAALRADLALLRPHFDGLITYSSAYGLDALPRLAREAGFRAVILGVWDPTDPAELGRALAAARAEPEIVLALSLGNEGLFFGRYDPAALAAAFARARREAPGVALARQRALLRLPRLAAQLLPAADLWLPTVHPIDQPWFGERAARDLGRVRRERRRRARDSLEIARAGEGNRPAERSKRRWLRRVAASRVLVRARAAAAADPRARVRLVRGVRLRRGSPPTPSRRRPRSARARRTSA